MGKYVKADRCFQHPDWSRPTPDTPDVGLIRLRPEDALTAPTTRPFEYNSICLPGIDVALRPQEVFEVAGMGLTENEDFKDQLQRGRLTYRPDSCDEDNQKENYICVKAEGNEARFCSVSHEFLSLPHA